MALQSESTESPREQNSHLQGDMLCCLMLISSAITWTEPQEMPTVRDWVGFTSQNTLGCLANACGVSLVGGAVRSRGMLHPPAQSSIPALAELFINHTPWAVLTQPLSGRGTRSPTLAGGHEGPGA